MENFQKIYGLLTPDERRRALLVIGLMIVSAAIQTAGVASVFPFLAVLGNPEIVQTNWILRRTYEILGFTTQNGYILFLGVASIVVVLGSGIIRLATEYRILRFVEMRRHSLSFRLLKHYLRQPYPFFLDRNSADLSKGILSEVDEVVGNVFYPVLWIPAYGLVAVGVIVLLFVVDPVIAGVVAMIVGGLYACTYLGIARLVRRRGQARVRSNRERFTTASEAFGGIKDVKLLGREEAYLKRFERPSIDFSRHRAFVKIISAVPRYLIEAVGFGGVLVLAVVLMATGDDLGRVLPVLGVYAFGGYKLLPAAQSLYAQFTKLRFGFAAVEDLHKDFIEVSEGASRTGTAEGARISLKDEIRWRDVGFRYPGSERWALKDVDLSIEAGSTVAFVGPTGAGKTTAVDLILGLLRPTKGNLSVDGRLLEEEASLRAWQNTIGYVPQQIYLADDTVAANIAFGIPEGSVDMEAVRKAARLASLHHFIEGELPDAYETIVGERGIRISGGQRQRLGIARALYSDPSVLVLDEATSSLDAVTEQAVMAAVSALEGNKTIILIAHRLSTVREAKKIFLLSNGRLMDTGGFEELTRRSPKFRELAGGLVAGSLSDGS